MYTRKNLDSLYLHRIEGEGSGTGSGSGTQTAEPPKPKPPKNDSQSEKGFPAETAINDMSPEQQAAYWKYHHRKNESLLKNSVSQDTYKSLQDELDKLRKDKLSEQERELEEARSQARQEGERATAERYQKDLVIARLQLETGQEENALQFLDHKAFLTDSGEVDTDKVADYASSLNVGQHHRTQQVSAAGSMDAGNRGSHDGGTPSTESGRDRFRSRNKKNN